MTSLLNSLLRRGRTTHVERYWTEHTVNSTPFTTPEESEAYLEWRFEKYPGFRELTGFWGDHEGETIVDYGCGPGNDVVGFLLYSGAAKVIAFDVSPKALGLARQRLELHGIDRARYELRKIDDTGGAKLPLGDAVVDFVNCQGVLHHVSNPEHVLEELRRVAKPSARGLVMVYNRNSVYYHLYVAYLRMIEQGLFPGATVDEAFTKSTDGPECPIARAYRPSEFVELCEGVGFAAEFEGAYLADEEPQWLDDHLSAALSSPELAEEHKSFLRSLDLADGRPTYNGTVAGIGGVYRLAAR